MVISLLAVVGICIIAWAGVSVGLQSLFGVVLPLAAVLVFLSGFVWRIFEWAKAPVPFPIATTGGQQRSLSFIKPARLDSPYTTAGVIGRMILEVLLFRSLFRNTKSDLVGDRVVHWSSKWLWVFSLTFHYCFLIIFIRHFRLFTEPVPFAVFAVETLDGIMQIGVPRFFLSNALILAGLAFLLLRRMCNQRLRYISLPSDYFPLFLIIGLVTTGILMRYFFKADVATIKVLTMGLATLSPSVPDGISPLFFIHVTLFSVLLMYFPFSKLMHMGGIFMSPTRNLPNNTRAVMHVNPWNTKKTLFTYAEYENEFREVMDEAGLPLEISLEEAEALAEEQAELPLDTTTEQAEDTAAEQSDATAKE